MRASGTIIFLAIAAFSDLASASFYKILLERQEPGTPRYECHAACGGVISRGEQGNDYCSDSSWQSSLQSCLDCANTFGIWQFYGDHVTELAGECQANAEPSASGFVSGDSPASTGTSESTLVSTPVSTPITTPISTPTEPAVSEIPTPTTAAAPSLQIDSGVSILAGALGLAGFAVL